MIAGSRFQQRSGTCRKHLITSRSGPALDLRVGSAAPRFDPYVQADRAAWRIRDLPCSVGLL